jgi:hypothetical protein
MKKIEVLVDRRLARASCDQKGQHMRFMILVKATRATESGEMPSEEVLAAMAKYNEELIKAGVMLAGEGLQPTSKGARVRFDGASRTVVEGPFGEGDDLVAGFWIFQCRSREEAIEWVKRCPNPTSGPSEIEIRQVVELTDFVQSEAVKHHERLRGALGG